MIEQLPNGDYLIDVVQDAGWTVVKTLSFRGNKGDWYSVKTGEKATPQWTRALDGQLKLKEWEEIDKGNT